MSATAAPTFSSMTKGSLNPLSPLFSPKNLCPFLSIPSKHLKTLHLSSSCSFSTLFYLKSKLCPSRGPLIPLVAQTSDWARHDKENEVNEVGIEWEEEQVEETEASISDLEGEGDELSGFEEEEEGEEGGFVAGEDAYSEPPEEAKIFVGNLSYEVESADLAELFSKAGIVETAEVIYNRETEQSRGFGFVTMSTVEEADKAVEMFNRYDVNGRLLTVNKAAPRGSRVEQSPRGYESTFKIYVGNLPWGVDDARLEQVFSEHGKVVAARVVYDRESGRSRGFGFVTMSSQTELDDAIAALDGQSLDGRAVRVNAAEERPRRGAF